MNDKRYNTGISLMILTWIFLVPVILFLLLAYWIPADTLVEMRATAKADQIIEQCFANGGCTKSYETCSVNTIIVYKKIPQ